MEEEHQGANIKSIPKRGEFWVCQICRGREIMPKSGIEVRQTTIILKKCQERWVYMQITLNMKTLISTI